MRTEADRGYAMIVALTAVAAFAYVAFQVLAANQGVFASAAARAEQAKLTAAADAGVMVAVHGLGVDDPSQRWPIDGSARHVDFNGADLTVTVDDERAKAPLVGLNPDQASALFEGAGASGERLSALVEEFDQWRAEAPVNASGRSISADAAHHFRSVGELMALPEMTPDLYNQIAPSVTVFFEAGGHFDPEYATPLALAAMRLSSGVAQPGLAAPVVGSANADDHLAGRTLAVHVLARDAGGDEASRTAIVELTGAKSAPYWIRYIE